MDADDIYFLKFMEDLYDALKIEEQNVKQWKKRHLKQVPPEFIFDKCAIFKHLYGVPITEYKKNLKDDIKFLENDFLKLPFISFKKK